MYKIIPNFRAFVKGFDGKFSKKDSSCRRGTENIYIHRAHLHELRWWLRRANPPLYKRKEALLYDESGADGETRTRDLILTKDVLYRLSYISIYGDSGQI